MVSCLQGSRAERCFSHFPYAEIICFAAYSSGISIILSGAAHPFMKRKLPPPPVCSHEWCQSTLTIGNQTNGTLNLCDPRNCSLHESEPAPSFRSIAVRKRGDLRVCRFRNLFVEGNLPSLGSCMGVYRSHQIHDTPIQITPANAKICGKISVKIQNTLPGVKGV